MGKILTQTQKEIIRELSSRGINTSLIRTNPQVVEVILTDVYTADLEKMLEIAKKFKGFIRFYAEDRKVVCRFHDFENPTLKCVWCGKKYTIEEAYKLGGCHSYCSKECCNAHARYLGMEIPECPCY